MAVCLLGALILVVAGQKARAAPIEEVPNFGSNPGNLRMFRYVPDSVPDGAPVVVAMHGCGQDASGYGTNSGWTELAAAHGFSVVLPQQRSANNANSCFNWFKSADTARGSGEALSIKQMVGWMRAEFDSGSAYVTGLSAGAAMTAVMLAAYPGLFDGGGIVAGIPYRCATALSDAFMCMNPGVDRSPQQWGDEVRAAAPETATPPKVSIWHGSADTTVAPMNRAELMQQWTNVHGTDQTADVSDTVAGYAHKVYGSVVETYDISGMGHGQPIDPGSGGDQCGSTAQYILDVNICAGYYMADFWGLIDEDPPPTSSTESPEPTHQPACFTDDNYGHVAAERAYTSGGYTYAKGSGQAMGLYNTYVTHTLEETSPDHYVIADQGCP